MPSDTNEALLSHYVAELAYLSNAGSEFARQHPDVAGALELAPLGSTDPHVERLIESFAFLTARLQRTYDAQLPEVPAALLDALYPQLTTPIPSMSIAAFVADPAARQPPAGTIVPADTELLTEASDTPDGLTCRFRTAYPVNLCPIEVAEARLEPPALHPFLNGRPDARLVLRIRLRCRGNKTFGDLAPPSLRFFLPQVPGSREAIYELLFRHALGIAVASPDTQVPPPDEPYADARWLPDADLRDVGFGSGDALLPCPAMSHHAFRLLQEYFTFPDKFYFFDVGGLAPGDLGNGSHLDLILPLAATPLHAVTVTADNFALGCTPVINLFPRTSEPIRLDHLHLEYPLVADARRHGSTGIHSIQRVTRMTTRADRVQTIDPLLSFGQAEHGARPSMSYYARRRQAPPGGLDSNEILLSFVDPGLNPAEPAGDTVVANILCTNRGLAEQIGPGTRFHLEVDLPVASVTCRMRPTRQIPPPADARALWRMVSHLSANHLSITAGPDGIAALREILKLYCPSASAAPAKRIDGLTGLSTRHIVRHVGADAWRGFCRGLQITLEFDRQKSADPGIYLMGSILSRFFGLYTAVNSFTELVVVVKGGNREEPWRWPPLTGDIRLL